MIYNQIFLEVEAKKYGFIRDTYEKVLRLLELLNYVDENIFLRERLALKGGRQLIFFSLSYHDFQ